MEGCGLYKEEKWRGLCISLPFFFLETEQEGEGNGRGDGQAMGASPLVHGNAWGGGKNGEEAMVSGGGELQREVEEGRC
jgi:hypothetical protein